jgi:hypothetical protein
LRAKLFIWITDRKLLLIIIPPKKLASALLILLSLDIADLIILLSAIKKGKC